MNTAGKEEPLSLKQALMTQLGSERVQNRARAEVKLIWQGVSFSSSEAAILICEKPSLA